MERTTSEPRNHNERRRYFRVDDKIALTTRVVPREELDEVLEQFDRRRTDFRLLNLFAHQHGYYRQELSRIERRYPEIANYLRLLQGQIDVISRMLARDDAPPDEPTHPVNISAQGVRFFSPEPIEPETIVELRLRLFPRSTTVLLYGAVVSCEPPRADDPPEVAGQFAVAVDFRFINQEDRELLIRHVDGRKLEALKERPRPDLRLTNK
jgi:hypothetical protein